MKYYDTERGKIMKSKIKSMRFFAVFLVITLMLTSMPLSIFAVESTSIEDSNVAVASGETEFGIIPKEELEEAIVLSEVISRREENVKHFDIGNGMYQAVTYGTAVHRKDANGIWQDIDNRLLLDSENNIYSTSDGRTKAALSINTNDPLISLSENGYAISMTPITKSLSASSSAQIVNHKAKTFDNISGASIKEVADISNSSSIKYTNVFAATDIEYVLEANDIKENIIVKSPQNSYVYSFDLSVDNLVPILKQTGDIVLLDDETFEEKYHIPAPFMYDSSGDLSYDVHYELNGEKGSYIVTVIADPEWVNADNRSFPVTIDPTVKKSVLFDTYINSSSAATNYGTSAELWISSGKITFLRCSMPSLPAGCSFYAANLYVYYYYYSYITDGGLTAGAYQVMNSWSETGLTWNIAQPNTTQYISSTRLSTGYMSGARGAYSSSPKTTSFDVTNAAASWYADSSTNHGIALKYESGTNTSVILKSYEAGSDYRAYFVITYIEPQILSGVYRIKNAQNGLYLDTTGGGYTAGTEIQQWSRATSDTNRNQLFKITFVRTFGSTAQLNYYTIRPMTNSAMGLESSFSGTSRDVTIEEMSTGDDWANLLYNHLWVISKSGSYYTIKNGRIADTSYLTAPSNTINGETVFTSDSVTAYSKWVLEPYTGEDLYGVGWLSYSSNLIVGERFYYEGYMYDADVGKNGPIKYSVTNTDGSATDKATINTYIGSLKAEKPGQIRVRMTYDGAPWIWWWTVNIEKSMEGTYFIQNRHYGKYIQVDDNDSPNYSNNGGIMEQWSFDGGIYQRWVFTHVGNGYYKITSAISGYAITVPSGKETNDGVDLVLKPYTGSNNQKWKIVLTSHGSYKIKAKSSEGYTSKDLVMRVNVQGLHTADGLNIQQRVYSGDEDYKAEWRLRLITNAYSIGGEFHSGVDVIDASNNWGSCGYNSNYTINPVLTDLCQENLNSSVVYFSSHGNQHLVALLGNIYLTDGLTSSYASSVAINTLTLDSAKLYIYDACLTASNKDGTGKNLCTQTIDAGAECVIGWQESIGSTDAKNWQARFQSKLVSGTTVLQAANYANTFSYNDNVTIKSWLIYGNSSLVINVNAAAGTQPIYYGAPSLNDTVENNTPIQSIDEIDDIVNSYIGNYSFKRTIAYTNLEQSNYVVDYVLTHNGFSTDYGVSVIVENHKISQIANRMINCNINYVDNERAPVMVRNSVEDALQEACLEIAQNANFSRIVNQKYDLYYDANTNQYYYRIMTVYETSTGTYGADSTLHRIVGGQNQ